MDNAQIEQELEDLEAKLERVRALYEQYFMGLEKLEPAVLRKEVDRKTWALRREQIRNTGLRFKFQMLIQRYNTYQQYWTRIVREIENGTYRRDILKVAQRFGEKEALTILGKKRAEQYKRLAKNQLERRKRWKNDDGDDAKKDEEAKGEEEIALGADDYELVEDEAEAADEATPRKDLPPVRGVHDHGGDEPDMESLLMFATVGVKDWSAAPRSEEPRTEAKAEAARAEEPRREAARGAEAKAEVARVEEPKREVARAEGAKVEAVRAEEAPPAAAAKVEVARAEDAKIEALRADEAKAEASGGGAETAKGTSAKAEIAKAGASTAAKSRVAELAAQMRAKKEAAKAKSTELELDNLLDSAPGAALAPPARPSPTASAADSSGAPSGSNTASASTAQLAPSTSATTTPIPKVAPTSATTTPIPKVAPTGARPLGPSIPQPAPSQPRATSPFPRPASTTALPGAPSAAASSARAAVPSAPKPSPEPARPPNDKPPRDDLSDQKMREIYAKYVGAKRAANESTAGITYDKLATSLRAQVEKLKSAHPTRTIDFEVVTKDGKTALRPIVK